MPTSPPGTYSAVLLFVLRSTAVGGTQTARPPAAGRAQTPAAAAHAAAACGVGGAAAAAAAVASPVAGAAGGGRTVPRAWSHGGGDGVLAEGGGRAAVARGPIAAARRRGGARAIAPPPPPPLPVVALARGGGAGSRSGRRGYHARCAVSLPIQPLAPRFHPVLWFLSLVLPDVGNAAMTATAARPVAVRPPARGTVSACAAQWRAVQPRRSAPSTATATAAAGATRGCRDRRVSAPTTWSVAQYWTAQHHRPDHSRLSGRGVQSDGDSKPV